MLTPIMRELPGRVHVIRLGWLFALTIYLGALAPAATEYPDRPITVIIPFPPGGSTGYTAKVLAEEMAKIVSQPVAVEPKTGNFGINAIEAIIGKADGYTLLVGSIITNSMTPVMHRQKIRFDYDKEVVPVTKLAAFPSVLMTAPSTPADNLKGALARLKGSGKLRFGTDFPGTYVDVDFINLGKAADLKVSMRSANGALAILDDLIADKIDMAMLNVATATANRGKYKPLAVTGTRPLPNFPGVPTMAEAGFPQIGTSNWQGLFAAAGASPAVIAALHRTALQAMSSPPSKEEFANVNAEIATSRSPQDFAAEIRSEMANWEKLVPEVLALPAEQ
jgi:tripartite-type tricarboxylate transporter receptor subunit TctC